MTELSTTVRIKLTINMQEVVMITTKDYVASELIRSSDYISGEALSDKLGISRAAINSAVKALRSEGYDIESSTRKGYLLKSHPDVLSIGEMLPYLNEDRLNLVTVLDETDSTNKVLKELGSDGAPEGTIVISDCQLKGRGRLGRSFLSPHGKGIYFSYLIRPTTRIDEISTITAWTAVAISNAIDNVYGVRPDIKWVNDLLINKKKICGILTELSLETESGRIDSIVVGIGVNVNHTPEDFPPELRDIASSISYETKKLASRSRLASEMVLQMDNLVSSWSNPEGKDLYLEQYRSRCINIGREIACVNIHAEGAPRPGKALAINDDFSIKIEFEDGEKKNLSSGEVSVRGLYGYV